MKRFITKKQIVIFLICVFAAIFLFSGISLIYYLTESQKQKDIYTDLAQLIVTAPANSDPAPIPDPTATDPATGMPTEPEPAIPQPSDLVEVTLASGKKVMVMRKYAQIYELNPDMAGWLSVPGTNINYPVMYTPNDPEYYLKKNFYKEYSAAGSLFLQYTCDPFTPSDNITIYGHHMKDGSMFAELMDYKTKSYWEEHQTFEYDTIYEEHTYQIIAVFKTTAIMESGFPFHAFAFAKDEADFDAFVSTCKKKSLYDTGITAEYGDKLLCLATCEYSQNRGRLVIVAKRIS